jgi:hypothetical protein
MLARRRFIGMFFRRKKKEVAGTQKICTLAEYMMLPIVQPLIQIHSSGKEILPLASYLSVGGFLFETGAILGWIYQDNQIDFVRVFSLPETPTELVSKMRAGAKQRVSEWESSDDSFLLFIYETELARYDHPIKMKHSRGEDYEKSKENFRIVSNWVASQIFERYTAWVELHKIFYDGIGYGFEFPQETQRRWKALYEKPKTPNDLISWRRAYDHGAVTTPEPSPVQTWDERISEIKDAFKAYITEFKPKLNDLIVM